MPVKMIQSSQFNRGWEAGMEYMIGTLLVIRPKQSWAAYVSNSSGDHVRIVRGTAVLPDGEFLKVGEPLPRQLVVGEKIAYVPTRDEHGRLRAKVWRPVEW